MSVTQLIAEGFQSALLPCSLILLVPGLAVALTARAAFIPASASFAVGAIALSWARFSDRGGGFHPIILAIAFALAAIILLVPLRARLDVLAVVAGLLTGAASAELWRPCVGSEFGQLLNELPSRGYSGLALIMVYLTCVLAPLAGLAAIHHLIPEWMLDRAEPAWAVIGGVVLAVLAFSTAIGLHEDFVSRLYLWSGGV